MYNKYKKFFNRIFLFIFTMPFGWFILAPFFLVYCLFLLRNSEGRLKLRGYLSTFQIVCIKALSTKGRKELWDTFKDFWNGKNL